MTVDNGFGHNHCDWKTVSHGCLRLSATWKRPTGSSSPRWSLWSLLAQEAGPTQSCQPVGQWLRVKRSAAGGGTRPLISWLKH